MADKYISHGNTYNGDGSLSGEAYPGYQENGLTGKTGATETGLAQSTTYYFKVNADGGGDTEYNITTATDTTYTAVIVLMNTALAGSSYSLVSGDLRCTSDTVGSSSSIAQAQGTSGTDLFSTLTDWTAFDTAIAGVEGAWNDLKAIMSVAPTRGTLSPGDVVHIRTQISGTDVTVDFGSAALTCYNVGTATNPVTWLADDGTVWSGDSGTLTIQYNGDSYDLIMGSYAIYKGQNFNWVWENTGGTGHQIDWLHFNYSFVISCKFTYQTASTNIGQVSASMAHFISCYYEVKRGYQSDGSSYGSITAGASGTQVYLTDVEFDASTYPDNVYNYQIALRGSYGCGIHLFGCKESNANADKEFMQWREADYSTNSHNGYLCRGMDFGNCNTYNYSRDCIGTNFTPYISEDINGIPWDFVKEDATGRRMWRRGKNTPTLNALLPNGTAWSILVLPGIDVSKSNPMLVMETAKLFNLTTAQRKITVNFVVKDTSDTDQAFDNLTKYDWWIVVSYMNNATGKFVTEHSVIDSSALDTSDVPWVPQISGSVVYGENTYNIYKIELTTTYNIKQNTLVNVSLFTTRHRIASSDYNFVDPDFTMEAV